jgi:ADP-heptose:LPS heptosyltransferase
MFLRAAARTASERLRNAAVQEMHGLTLNRPRPSQRPLAHRTVPLSSTHRRILWCLRYGIGDVVMELPLIEPLRRVAPDAHVTVLGAHPAIELLDDDPRIDVCVTIQQLGLSHRWDRGSAPDRLRIDEWLRDGRFDVVLDSRHAPPAATERMYAAKIPRIDSDPDVEQAVVASGRNAVEAVHRSVAAGWGMELPEECVRPEYHVRTAHSRAADELLSELPATALTIGIAPVASLGLKRWPIDRFVALAGWVLSTLDASVLLFCGPDRALGVELRELVPQPERCLFVGPRHLGTVSALLARCEALVANDTGITHIAAAVGTPTVTIFGPTAPRIYNPDHPRALSVGGEDVLCEHRSEHSLEPPGCWYTDDCLLGGEGCIRFVEAEHVRNALLDAIAYSGSDASA